MSETNSGGDATEEDSQSGFQNSQSELQNSQSGRQNSPEEEEPPPAPNTPNTQLSVEGDGPVDDTCPGGLCQKRFVKV